MSPAASPAALAWQHTAACRDADPELFFPLGQEGGPAYRAAAAAAKAVCAGCPVTRQCLAWAEEVGDGWAVLGGLAPGERHQRAAAGRPRRRRLRCTRCGQQFWTQHGRYCSPYCRRAARWARQEEEVRAC